MTNQERPTGEHEELRTDLPTPASVVVAEQEEVSQPKQTDQQIETSATLAVGDAFVEAGVAPEQPAEAESSPAVESAAVDADAAPAADEPAAAADEPADEPAAAIQVEETEELAGTEAAPEAAAAVEPDAAEPTSTPVEADRTVAAADTAAAVETPAAEPPAAESPVETSEATLQPEPVLAEATEATSESTAEEASYTPVAEDETGRPRRVKDLEPGMELEGRVTSIALYGIFVDIGVGRDGLVHISEMSDTRIESPSDLVHIGDTVHVRVKSVDPDGRRISLTMRSSEREGRGRGRKKPEVDRERLASLRVGDVVEGTVTGIAQFGVFVDIGVGKDGLVHISELTEGRIDKPEDAVQVGETYPFKLLEVDAEGTRISLSLRRAQRSQRMQQLEKGQIIEGKISGIAPFGAFVDIGVGRDGLVHISELATERVNKVEDVVNVGDPVTVRVLEVDPQSKRISLSMLLEERPREEAPAREPARESRPRRDRPPRANRAESDAPAPAQYSTSSEADEEEDVPASATLEDLLSKYGNGGKRDKRRRRAEDEEEDFDDRQSRRQRDAIRRTLQLGEDE